MFKTIICKNNGKRSEVFVYEDTNETLYVEKGGTIVNKTVEIINQRTDIDELMDFDSIASSYPIEDIDDFEKFISI